MKRGGQSCYSSSHPSQTAASLRTAAALTVRATKDCKVGTTCATSKKKMTAPFPEVNPYLAYLDFYRYRLSNYPNAVYRTGFSYFVPLTQIRVAALERRDRRR